MKKSSLNYVTNNQLIILAVSFTIFGFVLLLFDDGSRILHAYYFSIIFWIIAVVFIGILIVRDQKDDDVTQLDNSPKENSQKDNVLPTQKATTNASNKVKNNRKLITCSTCGASIARTAKHCPHCGARTPGETVNQTVQGIGCGILFAIIFIPCFIAFVYFITVLKAF